MTRINVGIYPRELCDQHLIAEYKELPRAFALRFGEYRTDTPKNFCLGRGHVLWCGAHAVSLMHRFDALVAEMQARGFNPKFTEAPDLRNEWQWADWEEQRARRILIPRICSRLVSMSREPKWTNRVAPEWVLYALEER